MNDKELFATIDRIIEENDQKYNLKSNYLFLFLSLFLAVLVCPIGTFLHLPILIMSSIIFIGIALFFMGRLINGI